MNAQAAGTTAAVSAIEPDRSFATPMPTTFALSKTLLAAGLLATAFAAHADAVDTLRDFVREVKTGRASFTQTVTSPDGARRKSSSGQFEFSRPDRFRFQYSKPFEQTIVADGEKVWIYDADLHQASSRRLSSALGATPAALLAGGSLDKDFTLAAQASQDGLDWVQARPKSADGSLRELRIGFKGKVPAALEILDGFGQRSLLQFAEFQPNVSLPPASFRFTLPQGAELIEQ